METFFKHGTVRDVHKPGQFLIAVEKFTPAIYRDEEDMFRSTLPFGAITSQFSTELEVMNEVRSRLLGDDWTPDMGLAKRRSAKQLEQRASGQLRFGGPNRSEGVTRTCDEEVIAIR